MSSFCGFLFLTVEAVSICHATHRSVSCGMYFHPASLMQRWSTQIHPTFPWNISNGEGDRKQQHVLCNRNSSLQDTKTSSRRAEVSFCLPEDHAEFSGPGMVKFKLEFRESSYLTSMYTEASWFLGWWSPSHWIPVQGRDCWASIKNYMLQRYLIQRY